MLWDVLLEVVRVLLDKIGVVGLLRCHSLTLKSRQSRQITADLLRSTANAIAPEQDGKTFLDRVKDAVVEKVMEGD